MEEEIINKPDNQFKAILNDIIDYPNHGKNALIKELTQRPKQTTKPASSLSSSTYSSAASSNSSTSSSSSSSSSTSSTSDNSSTNSTSSSTLSSPSQTNNINNNNTNPNNKSNNTSNDANNDTSENDKVEIAKIEDLRRKARIIRQDMTRKNELYGGNLIASASHSDISKSSLKQMNNNTSKINVPMNVDLTQQHNQQQQQQINSTNLTHEVNMTATPWKTISGKRDKRRKRPVEQPVLSQHIPGHKGEQEVDWLVNFIESGTTNGANNVNSSNKNNTKSRPQNKSDSNNHNTASRNNNTKNSNYTTLTPIISNNGQSMKKNNENFPVNNQKQNQQPSSKMNNITNQVRDAPAPPSPPQTNIQQNNHQSLGQSEQNVPTTQSETRKPIAETNNREQSQQQQQQQQRTKIIISNKPPQQMRQHFKSLSNNSNQNPSSSLNTNQRKLHIQPTQQSQQQSQQQSESSLHSSDYKQLKRSVLTHSEERHHVSQSQQQPASPSTGALDEDIVTFADHIKVNDKQSTNYTFGFFDEQPGKHQIKLDDKSSKTNNEQPSQQKPTNDTTIQTAQENKHQDASLNSEQKRYTFNDNIDANSFNYNQILEFISNAWEKNKKSQNGKACNNRIVYAR